MRGLARYGDASPDLAYCAEELIAAFPDAQILQVVRDGRDVVAGMLADPAVMSWFRPSVANIDTEFPNPFYGVEDEVDRSAWRDVPARASAPCAGGGRSGWRPGCARRMPEDQLEDAAV